MKPFLLGVIVIVLLAAGYVRQEQANTKLRNDIAQLRADVRQLATQQAAAAQTVPASIAAPASATPAEGAGTDREELARLRRDMTTLLARTQEIATAAQAAKAAAESGHAADALPVRLTPASAWKNAGKATPAAAMETALWAAVGGDVDTVADSIGLTAAARKEADAMFAQLSDQTRAQYGTPEKLLALMIAREAAGVSGMQVLGQKEISADDVGLRLRVANDQGQTKEDSFLLHRGPDGYRLMLSDAAVKKFAKQIGGGK